MAADKRPVPQQRHLPDWIHSSTTLARRHAHTIGNHWSVVWIGWSARGWWHIARIERGKMCGPYPQMMRTALAQIEASLGDTTKEGAAEGVYRRRADQLQERRRKYLKRRGIVAVPAAAVTAFGLIAGGLWVAALYAMAAVTVGIWKGRPGGVDPGKVQVHPEDGDPFPIADARNRTEAAECVRRALESEGISVKSIEANKRHAWGWEVTARLAKGKPADIIDKAADLETPLDLPENGLYCQPVRKSRGRVVLRLVEEDPFKNIQPAPERKPNSKRLKDKQLLAIRMDGQEFKTSLLGMHVIVIAKSGGGKSIILREVADSLTACSDVVVGDLDPGGNGVAPLAEAMGVRAIGDDNMGMIEAILEQSLKIAKGRPPLFHKLGMTENWEPSPKRPAIVLIGDEFPSWSDRAKQLAIKILRVSRKSRVQLVLAATEATKDALLESIANLFHLKIVGPCRSQDVTQVFGTGALANGWRPDRLDPAEGDAEGDDLRDASQAYIRGGGSQEPIKFKFLFLEDKEGRRRAKERAAAGRPEVDAESLQAAGLEYFGVTEADRLRSDLPQIVDLTRGAFAVADDPKFLTTLAIWEYLAERDPGAWALKLFGDDEVKARRIAAQKVAAELKRAVDEMELLIDMTTVQVTGGARGYYLDTIKQITGESIDEAA
ncbi:hypothetical protein ACIRF8_15395 [Streptomyces sp. NPDC102406]|uniref:hypothetical protein n=1 Tax=Streptomyces sp. NPDC102406 TaxID=3366171 RepID=UPI00380C1A1D